MANLQVIAVITAKADGHDEVRTAMHTLATATTAEDGCVSYELFESGSTPGTFITHEEWASQRALDAHLAGDDVARAMTAAGEHLAAAPAIHPLRRVGTDD